MALDLLGLNVEQLQGLVEDISGVYALPITAAGGLQDIAQRRIDALLNLLDLHLVFLRLNTSIAPLPIEVASVRATAGPAVSPEEIGASLDARYGPDPSSWPSSVDIGGLDLVTRVLVLGLEGGPGLLLVGARRADFPTKTEGLLMNAVAGQLTIELQNAMLASMRKRIEDIPRDKEEMLHHLVDSIAAEVTLSTPEGQIVVVNRTCVERTGRPFDRHSEWATGDLLHPDDLPRVRAEWARAVAAEDQYEVEVRSKCADGVYRWVHSHGFPIREAGGRIFRWCTLHLDIDDRKRAEEFLKASEEALAASERNLNQIVSVMPGLVWSANPDGAAVFLNQHYLDYVGRPLEQMLGWAYADTVHPNDVDRLITDWRKILASERPGQAEARIRRFDGEYRWFLLRGSPVYDASGRVTKWHGVNTDIEDRKRAEQVLRASEASLVEREQNLRQIIDTIPAMAWTADADGTVDFFNRNFLDYAGKPLDRMRDGQWTDTVHPDDVDYLVRTWATVMTSCRIGEAEARLRRSDGVYRWFLMRVSPLCDETGKVTRWYGVNADIDDLKSAEEDLRDAQAELAHVTRVMTMGHLTASIAHELNQPLAGIITNASTCLRMLAASPPNISGASETARRTIRDGNRAAEVITRLRALFKKRNTATEAVDLNAATQEVIALTTTELQRNGVSLHVDLADDLPSVQGDRVQLQQVIMNLILNAVEAMDGITDRAKDLVIATERDGDDHVRVAVQDSGTGIDADKAEKLFNPFYSTKSQGMGIGLSVSRSIVEYHKGRLWAEMNAGQGATFLVSIPSSLDVAAAHP